LESLPMTSGIEQLTWFIAAGVLLNLTPGPDVLFIVTKALKGGWRAGAMAALGITTGCLVHVAAAALGVSALMAASTTAFSVLKWAGAAYLAYMGWRMLGLKQADPKKSILIAPESINTWAGGQNELAKIFIQGFWTNVLNPKVALFFLAFLPQFIAPGSAQPWLSFLLLGLIFNFNGLWVNLAYAALGAAAAKRWTAMQHGLRALERMAGILFMGFGVKLALTDNPQP
jgi:threonine/homoserine/homoserine lactone efflux protein